MLQDRNSCLWYDFVETIVYEIYDEQQLYDNYENKKSLGISKGLLFVEHYSIEHLQFLVKELKILKDKFQSVINMFELWDLYKFDDRYYNGYFKEWREYYENVYPNELIFYSNEHIFKVQAKAYEYFNECGIFPEQKTISDLLVDDVEIALCSSYEHLYLNDFDKWIDDNKGYENIFWNTIYGMDNNILESSKDLKKVILEIEYILKNKVDLPIY